MRDCSVVRLNPILAAAPSAPPITPPERRRASRIRSRSGGPVVAHDDTGIGNRIGNGNLQHPARTQDDGTFHQVLQLADIARPVVPGECFERSGRNLLDRTVQFSERISA